MQLEVLPDKTLSAMNPAELMAIIARTQRLIERATAYQRRLITIAEARKAPRAVGDACVADSLVRNTGISRSAARRAARQAKTIAGRPAVAAAMERGRINADQAEAIARVEVDDETRGELVAFAARSSTDATRERALAAEVVCRDETPEERFMRQRSLRYLRFYDNRDGMVCVAAAFDPDSGARLKAKVAAFANRMWRSDKREPASRRRTPEQRDADALCAATSQRPAAISGASGGRGGHADSENPKPVRAGHERTYSREPVRQRGARSRRRDEAAPTSGRDGDADRNRAVRFDRNAADPTDGEAHGAHSDTHRDAEPAHRDTEPAQRDTDTPHSNAEPTRRNDEPTRRNTGAPDSDTHRNVDLGCCDDVGAVDDEAEWTDFDDDGKRVLPVLRVSTSLDALLSGLHDAGVTDSGEHLSAATLRRMACDAEIIPTVLNGKGRVIDVGRRTRRVNEALRCAIIERDRGCVWSGCGAPPSRCDCHHMRHWSEGGPTNADNLVLLCHRHHILLHEGGYRMHGRSDDFIVLRPDGTALHDPLAPNETAKDPPGAKAQKAVRSQQRATAAQRLDRFGGPLVAQRAVRSQQRATAAQPSAAPAPVDAHLTWDTPDGHGCPHPHERRQSGGDARLAFIESELTRRKIGK